MWAEAFKWVCHAGQEHSLRKPGTGIHPGGRKGKPRMSLAEILQLISLDSPDPPWFSGTRDKGMAFS